MSGNVSSVQTILSKIENCNLVVLDFSILMTLRSNEPLEWISSALTEGRKPILVTSEFYRCYRLISKSESKEQQSIAENARSFLHSVKQNGLLKLNSDYTSTESLITNLSSNPDVLFMFSVCSEASEIFRKCENAKANVLYGLQDGKISCAGAVEFRESFSNDVYSRTDNNYIPPKRVPAVTETVYDPSGNPIKLVSVISKGGEGTVFDTDIEGYVCKIYHSQKINFSKVEKLKFLQDRQVHYQGICWPEKTVSDGNGNIVGYIMKKAAGKSMSYIFDGEDSIKNYSSTWKRSDLVKICISLLEQYQYLHLLGIVIGDIRMQNVTVDTHCNTYLLDLDSCQIDNFPCEVGDEDYTPSELQGAPFSTFLRTFENEKFAWSVILFNILFLGQHPYAQRNGFDTIAEEIANFTFRYPNDINGSYSLIPFGCYSNIWKITPEKIRIYFSGIFRENVRPPLSDVLTYFDEYLQHLENGPASNNPENVISYNEILSRTIPSDSSTVSLPGITKNNKQIIAVPKEPPLVSRPTNPPLVSNTYKDNDVTSINKKTRSKLQNIAITVCLSIMAAMLAFIIAYFI